MVNEYLKKIIDFIMNDPRLSRELEEIKLNFPQLELSDPDRELMILDWFLFDYRLKKSNITVLDTFLNIVKPTLSESEWRSFENFRNGILALFEVKALRIGKDLILRDLTTGKEYWVWDTTASKNLRKNQCAFIRVLPFKDHYILFGSVHAYPKEVNIDLNILSKTLRESHKEFRITSKDIADYLYKVQSKNSSNDDYISIAKQLEKKIDAVGLSDVNIYRVMEDITQGRIQHVGELYREFHKKAKFANRNEEEELLQMLVTLWNKMPHKYMGGVSPEEKRMSLKRGPLEESLIKQMLAHIQIHFNPEKYFDDKSRQKAVRRLQKKWLDTPMIELNNKSPRAVILEERKKSGSNNTRIGYTIDIHPVYDSDKDQEAEKLFEAGLQLSSQGKYREAAEAYRCHLELFPDNYVAWGNLGSVYCMLIDKKEAEWCLRKALSIKPDYQIAKNNLSRLKRISIKKMKEMAKNHKIKFQKP